MAKFNCAFCGKEFNADPHRIKRNKGRICCSKKCSYSLRIGPNHPSWKGGRQTDRLGYVRVYCPDHPFTNNRGYVQEHRLIVEKKIGRYLNPSEIVHHIDGNPGNNHPDNLVIVTSKRHRAIHPSTFDEESRKLLSEATKRKWENPLTREKFLTSLKKRWQDPSFKNNISIKIRSKMTELWKDASFRENRRKSGPKRSGTVFYCNYCGAERYMPQSTIKRISFFECKCGKRNKIK
jgi:hypothetical protein